MSERYFPYARDISFVPPDGWADRTMAVFVSQPDQTGASSIVVTREPLRGETVRTFADKQFGELARGLKQVDLLESRAVTLGGTAGILRRFTWLSTYGKLEQLLVYLAGTTPGEPSVVIVTATCLAEHAPAMRPVFARVLESIQLPAAPVAPPPPPQMPTLPDTLPVDIPMPGMRLGRGPDGGHR